MKDGKLRLETLRALGDQRNCLRAKLEATHEAALVPIVTAVPPLGPNAPRQRFTCGLSLLAGI